MPWVRKLVLLLAFVGAAAPAVGRSEGLKAMSREENEEEDAILQDLEIVKELEMLHMMEMLQEMEILRDIDPLLPPGSEREEETR